MELFNKTYYCHKCKGICGEISITEESGKYNISILGFNQELHSVVEPKDVNNLIYYFNKNELIRVYEIDREFAPFFCIQCYESYCTDCWDSMKSFDEGFYDAEYGICPKGHRRMLFD